MTELSRSQKRRAKDQKTQPALKSHLTLRTMFDKYQKSTPVKLKIIDAYSLYACVTAAIQLVYVCLVGTFPFNAFLSGFISCVASVVAAASLRSQVNPQNTYKFPNSTPEKAFAEFVFFHIVLHLAVVHFMG
uniref:Dolichyl-diphosphooligosaccharide--protein glycosyltransferase subunit DAD1 n=1 Tax=Lygus hesperus TaxID=30085 RepID=A0A0A9Y9T5_LYGHE